MVNPTEVITVRKKTSYMVPIFRKDENGKLEHVEDYRIDFCSGDQAGFLPETLIAILQQYYIDRGTEIVFGMP